MTRTIRPFLLLTGASFAAAAAVHAGVLIDGYEHPRASIAERVIAGVLLAGFGLTWVWPMRARPIGLIAQAFALLGTLVGAFTIAVGVGPRTVPCPTSPTTLLSWPRCCGAWSSLREHGGGGGAASPP